MSPGNWVICICQQSVFVATEVLRRVGGVREDLHCIMDTELYYRLFAAGSQYVRVDALIGMIREHADAKGIARRRDWNPERQKMFEKYGIRRYRVKAACARTKFCRLLDGSYLRSFALLRMWRGLRPWEVSRIT